MKLMRVLALLVFCLIEMGIAGCLGGDDSASQNPSAAGLSLFPSDFRANSVGEPVLPKPR